MQKHNIFIGRSGLAPYLWLEHQGATSIRNRSNQGCKKRTSLTGISNNPYTWSLSFTPAINCVNPGKLSFLTDSLAEIQVYYTSTAQVLWPSYTAGARMYCCYECPNPGGGGASYNSYSRDTVMSQCTKHFLRDCEIKSIHIYVRETFTFTCWRPSVKKRHKKWTMSKNKTKALASLCKNTTLFRTQPPPPSIFTWISIKGARDLRSFIETSM